MNLLLIEDDLETAGHLQQRLQEAGFSVEHAATGDVGLRLALAGAHTVIIVDRLLPQLDGLTLIRRLREAGRATPVMVLSALGTVDERVAGLRAGGDDYLVKPFAFSELLARLEALVRRGAAQDAPTPTRLQVGALVMDLIGRRVTRGTDTLELTAKEFQLLEFLMRRPGQVVTRSMLLEGVWDLHFDPQTNVVDVQISRLRTAIDRESEPSFLHTVRGAGYLLRAPA